MKLHLLFLQISIFICTIIFFVLPPLIPVLNNTVLSEGVNFYWTFPFSRLIQFFYAVILFLLLEKTINQNIKQPEFTKLGFTYKYVFPAFFVLCILFCISLFIKALSVIKTSASIDLQASVKTPENFKEWLFCILTFAFSAFYEEIIYRWYLPEQCNLFFKNKVVRYICAFAVLACFSFAHLYMGIFSVLNAALAHFILRLCFKKTGSIYPGICAHFCYNVLSLILL